MDLIKVLLFIGDPLFVAFMLSVIAGACFKRVSSILMIKRVFAFVSFWLYFMLYAYGMFALGGVAFYIIMFAPPALALIFVIVAVIAAPKGSIREGAKDNSYSLSGFDTAYPNDIDNYNP